MLLLTSPTTDLAPSALEILVEERPDETIVRARGEIDMATSPSLTSVLHRVSRIDAPVRLDLAEVAFMDSSGIHAVEAALQAAGRLGRALAIGPLSDAVTRTLALVATHKAQTP